MFALTRRYYVQLSENRVRVRDLDSGRECERRAEPPFSHPRLLVGDFAAAEACLKAAFAELGELGGKGFALKRLILMHPLEKVEGGLSPIERRVLEELARGAGGGKVRVWDGAPLGDAAALEKLGGA